MRETSKLINYRNKMGYSRFFKGIGIDIGAGNDPLIWPNCAVTTFDLMDGNGQLLAGIQDESFDFVYSSHCLEHMVDPKEAVGNWLRVCKTGGYLVIAVPHEIYYEKNCWPSMFNSDHKWSFRLCDKTTMPKSINLYELFSGFAVEYVQAKEVIENFNLTRFWDDQTLGDAVCQLEVVVRKVSSSLAVFED